MIPNRTASAVLGAAPCHSLPSNTNAVPAVPAAGTVGTLCGTEASGCLPERWLPGTMRVAPFCSVKSVIIHMALTVAAGAIRWPAGDGSRPVPLPRVMFEIFGLGSPGVIGGGIHHWSVCSGMVPAPGCWICASTQETR